MSQGVPHLVTHPYPYIYPLIIPMAFASIRPCQCCDNLVLHIRADYLSEDPEDPNEMISTLSFSRDEWNIIRKQIDKAIGKKGKSPLSTDSLEEMIRGSQQRARKGFS